MKRFIISILVAFLSCTTFAQTREELYARFEDIVSKREMSEFVPLISEWQKLYPNDAELYVVKMNYYFGQALTDVIVISDTAPTDGRDYYTLLDSLGVKSYMFPEPQIDSVNLKNAFVTLSAGISKNPDRIDMRFGKSNMYLKLHDNEAAVEVIQDALRRSIENNNKWFGTLDVPIESDGVSYMQEGIQDYLADFVDNEDIASAE